MKRHLLLPLAVALAALAAAPPSYACFDTYVFLQKQSLAYPKGLLAVETSGEYMAQDLTSAGEDAFSGGLNLYYGLVDRFSVQGALASSEKARSEFGFDEWGLRGVYGLVRPYDGGYSLDLVLEMRTATSGGSSTWEVSAPNIWYRKDVTLVVHPVMSLASGDEFGLRGHGGVFYSVGGLGIVGVGSEYESAQSSDHFSHRLVRGAGATSLFLGAALGPHLFLQNEFIKGWGSGGSDVGFAVTLKFLRPGGPMR